MGLDPARFHRVVECLVRTWTFRAVQIVFVGIERGERQILCYFQGFHVGKYRFPNIHTNSRIPCAYFRGLGDHADRRSSKCSPRLLAEVTRSVGRENEGLGAVCTSMRIRTDGKYEYRLDPINRAVDFYDCYKAIVSACDDVPLLVAATSKVLERADSGHAERRENEPGCEHAVNEVDTVLTADRTGDVLIWEAECHTLESASLRDLVVRKRDFQGTVTVQKGDSCKINRVARHLWDAENWLNVTELEPLRSTKEISRWTATLMKTVRSKKRPW